jgi:hypothetical protein
MSMQSESGDSSRQLRLCPSAPANSPDGMVIGVRQLPLIPLRIKYLPKPEPVTDDVRAAANGVPLESVLRVAAPCAETGCCHWDGECGLVRKVTRHLPADEEARLPPCRIRANCVWFAQEGRSACARCPQVVTLSPNEHEQLSVLLPDTDPPAHP